MNAPLNIKQPVSLVSTPVPFGQQRYFAALEGMTFAEMASRVDELPPFFWQGSGLVVVTITERGEVVREFSIPQWSDDGVNLWATGKPKCAPGQHMTVAFGVNLQGGGGGGKKNVLAIVALVAIIAISFAVSGGALGPAGVLGAEGLGAAFAAGATGAKIAAGVISIGGAMAIAALSKPPQTPTLAPRNDRPGGTASAQVNVLASGAPFPRVVGTKRMLPPALMPPLIEYSDDDAIVECVFGFAGDHKLPAKTIRLGGATPADGVVIKVRERTTQPLQTLVTRYGYTDGINLPLTDFKSLDIYAIQDGRPSTLRLGRPPHAKGDDLIPQWHSVPLRSASAVSGGPVNEHWINFQFAALFNSTADEAWLTVPFRARIRKINANGTLGGWVNLPEFHFVRSHASPFTVSLRILWRKLAGRPPAPPQVRTTDAGDGGRGGLWAYTHVEGQSATPRTAPWDAHPYFVDRSRRQKNHEVYSDETKTVFDLLNMVGKKDRWEVYLDPDVFTPGRYEMQIKRGSAVLQSYWNTKTRYQDPEGRDIQVIGHPDGTTTLVNINGELDLFHYLIWPDGNSLHRKGDFVRFDVSGNLSDCSISSVSAVINGQPSPSRDVATISFRGKNIGSPGALSVLASGLVPDYSPATGTWTGLKATSNPAVHARYIYTSALNATKVPGELIDDDAFVGFRSQCASKGYQCNAEIRGGTVPEAFALVAGNGFGGPANGEKFSVVWERDRSGEGPVQIFTPRNMNNFKSGKPFARFSDGQLVIYADKTNDYQDSSVLVWYAAGRATVEETRYEGPVTEGEAVRRSTFDQAHVRARGATFTWDASVESIRCKKGDLVGVQSPILTSQSGWGRIKVDGITVNGADRITSIVLDQSITPFRSVSSSVPLPQRTFGIQIQHADGATSTHAATLGVDRVTLTLNTPYANDSDIKQGCVVTAGTLGKESRRLIISEIRPRDTTSAQIVAFDEAPTLLAQLEARTAQIADAVKGAPIPYMLDFRYPQNLGYAAAA